MTARAEGARAEGGEGAGEKPGAMARDCRRDHCRWEEGGGE